MKDTTRARLIALLESKLGREATEDEKINAETDYNLISELSLIMVEENQ